MNGIIRCIHLLSIAALALGQLIEPSNDTARLRPDNELQLALRTSETGEPIVAQVLPLTARAGLNRTSRDLEEIHISGTLVLLIDLQTSTTLRDTDIAYVECRHSGEGGRRIAPSRLLLTAASRRPAAIVLFDTESHLCAYHAPADDRLSSFRLFTVVSPVSAVRLENSLRSTPPPPFARAHIAMDANSTSPSPPSNSGSSSSGSGNNNILGTSPTTAVAMIILYSITGVITALFLVIIVTGAVRAHRHPERYGPRAGGNGRPRQSRAKGIARAMLDTLPIVKFGEREDPKRPGDVEMAATAGSSEQATRSTEAGPVTSDAQPSTVEGSATGTMPTVVVSAQDEVTEAKPAAEGTTTEKESDQEGKLGCSICTEDFVKGEDVRVLPCDHKYHPECIDPWLLNVSGTCPLCRIDLRPAKDAQSSPASTDGQGQGRPQASREGGDAPEGSNRHSRVSRFMEFHLGLTPASEPEERIAALLRLREERRRGERRRHRTRDADDAAAGRSRSNSRRRSHLGGFIRDSFRRRSARMDTPTPTPDDERNENAAATADAEGQDQAQGTQETVEHRDQETSSQQPSSSSPLPSAQDSEQGPSQSSAYGR